MKILKNKIATVTIALFLILSMAASMGLLPNTNAHSPPWNIPTYAYVSLSPNTVGVGQSTEIVMQIDISPPTASGVGGDRWRGFAVDITKPDGTKEHIPYTGVTSEVGGAAMTYTPTMAGDYMIVFSWPGQTLSNGTGSPICFRRN